MRIRLGLLCLWALEFLTDIVVLGPQRNVFALVAFRRLGPQAEESKHGADHVRNVNGGPVLQDEHRNLRMQTFED